MISKMNVFKVVEILQVTCDRDQIEVIGHLIDIKMFKGHLRVVDLCSKVKFCFT